MIFVRKIQLRRFLVNTAILVALIAVSGLFYIRLAPPDIALLHTMPVLGPAPEPAPAAQKMAQKAVPQGYMVSQHRDTPPKQLLARLDALVLATPRTHVLAGSVEEGMITYVTRSLVFGFPDYTTIRVLPEGAGSRLQIHARQGFGRIDFGVNKARVTGWLKGLDAGRSP